MRSSFFEAVHLRLCSTESSWKSRLKGEGKQEGETIDKGGIIYLLIVATGEIIVNVTC